MKKIFYLLACALPVLSFISCDDDDNDIPDVDFSVQIDGGRYSDDRIYVVSGTDLKIESITVINQEQGKGALIPYANYYWDYKFLGQSTTHPYGYTIAIPKDYKPGNHILKITCPVYAVDKAPAFAVIQYNVTIVDSADQMPDNGTTTLPGKAAISDTDPSK